MNGSKRCIIAARRVAPRMGKEKQQKKRNPPRKRQVTRTKKARQRLLDIFTKEGGRDVKRGTLTRHKDISNSGKQGHKRGVGAIFDALNKTVAFIRMLHKEVDTDQGIKSSVADTGRKLGQAEIWRGGGEY